MNCIQMSLESIFEVENLVTYLGNHTMTYPVKQPTLFYIENIFWALEKLSIDVECLRIPYVQAFHMKIGNQLI